MPTISTALPSVRMRAVQLSKPGMMAASRAYLGAHWLSDAIAGLLLGISCALITASVVDQAQRRYARPGIPAAERSVPSADRR